MSSHQAFRRLCQVLAGVAVVCCSSYGVGHSREPVALPDALLLAREIARTDSRTAYEAVERLRPGFLRLIPLATRGDRSPTPTAVYLNGKHVGELDALHLIPASEVVSIKVVKPMHTTTVLGTGVRGGAILVETRSR